MREIELETAYYQHFDADFRRDVPGEGFGGWHTAKLPLNLDATAVVVMHAWDTGTSEQFPGWHRAVEYLPRANEIGATVFPPLLQAIRAAGIKLWHVVSPGDSYYQGMAGYRRTAAIAGQEPAAHDAITPDRTLRQLQAFRTRHVFPGEHNEADIAAGFARLGFLQEAQPAAGEAIAATSWQLSALCREAQVNHLIYIGFALNWCLLMSPGGMADMAKHGIMCSTISQAVTAVENKETARLQLNKAEALWRVALAFGFVYDADAFMAAIRV